MIERLILVRTNFRGDRLVPFVGIVEHRIDVEHDAAERIEAVPDDLADLIFGVANLAHGSGQITAFAAQSCKAAIVASAGPDGALERFIARIWPPYRGLWRLRGVPDRPAPWLVSRSRRPASCRRSSPRRSRPAWR